MCSSRLCVRELFGGWSKARQLVENLVTRLLEKDQPDNNVENFMGGVSA